MGEDGKLVSRVVDGGAGAGAGAGSEAVAAKAQQGHDAEAVSGADDPAALSTDSDIADVDAAADDSVVDEVDGADAAEEDEPPLRRSTKGKKGDAAASNTVDAQFVPLADVLPEIPQKGTFDVNEIKVRARGEMAVEPGHEWTSLTDCFVDWTFVCTAPSILCTKQRSLYFFS